jgi:glutamate dehydrogenase/leucine dehydrogenase
VADVKPSADGITEIRAFLRAPGSAAEAGGATVSGLLGRAQDSEVA